MATPPNQATKVITGKVRLSYAHLFEPFTNIEGAEARYSCVLLISKSDKATIASIRKAQQAALEAGKARLFEGKIPNNWKDTLRDGDTEADLDRNPEYAGTMFMAVNSRTRPGVVNEAVQPILDSTEVYSGCYVRASINCFPFSVSGNKGVSFGLNHIQKLSDGDFLGGRSKAEDDFDAASDDDDDVL